MSLSTQLGWLFVLAIPVACISWTWTHEEIFREFHEFFLERCKVCKTLLARKFYFALACEYCFSHYVTLAFLAATKFTLLRDDFIGGVIAWFSIVWIANIMMSAMALLRGSIKHLRLRNEALESPAPAEAPPTPQH